MNTRDVLRTLGEIRDGLLVAVTCIYVVGYITWALHAHLRNLGPVSALEAQYFLAGGATLLIATAGALLTRVMYRATQAVTPKTYWRTRDRVIWLAISLIGGLLCAFSVIHQLPAASDPSIIYSTVVSALFVFVFMALMNLHAAGIYAGVSDWFRAVMIVYGVLLASAALFLYVWFLYPLIPNTLGGGQLRNATVVAQSPAAVATAAAGIESTRVDDKGNIMFRCKVVSLAPDSLTILALPRGRDSSAARLDLDRKLILAVVWTKE